MTKTLISILFHFVSGFLLLLLLSFAFDTKYSIKTIVLLSVLFALVAQGKDWLVALLFKKKA